MSYAAITDHLPAEAVTEASLGPVFDDAFYLHMEKVMEPWLMAPPVTDSMGQAIANAYSGEVDPGWVHKKLVEKGAFRQYSDIADVVRHSSAYQNSHAILRNQLGSLGMLNDEFLGQAMPMIVTSAISPVAYQNRGYR